MDIPDQLRCLFSANVEYHDGRYVVGIPDRELILGEIQDGETYRVALFSAEPESSTAPDEETPDQVREAPTPPVEKADLLDVEIEDVGKQGDGIARVDRGYVVIVPETTLGERVTIRITDVRQTVAFAEIVKRHDHFH